MDNRERAELLTSCNNSPSLSRPQSEKGWMNIKLKFKLVELCKGPHVVLCECLFLGPEELGGIQSPLSHPFPAPWTWRRPRVLPKQEQASCSLSSCIKAAPLHIPHSGTLALQTWRPFSKHQIIRNYCKRIGFSLNSSFTVKRIKCPRLFTLRNKEVLEVS